MKCIIADAGPIISLCKLVLAKEKKLIDTVMPLLLEVRNNNYWVSDKLLQGIALKAKEQWKKDN